MKNKKFVCLECGCHDVQGDIPAIAEVKINSKGDMEILSMEWEFDGDGLHCCECSSCEIVEIGKRMVC